MDKKSRAEYFRHRRETRAQFMVMVDKETLSRLDGALLRKKMTRAAWLRGKIEEEIREGK